MRFIGSKSLMIPHIIKIIENQILENVVSVSDIFAGSGAVSLALKNIHDINLNYNACNYQSKNRLYHTKEILVTNY